MSHAYTGLVLAVHPTSRGFGWALFESPDAVVDWGIASAKEGRNAKVLARFKRLLNRQDPAFLVIEAFDQDESRRAKRIRTLCAEMLHAAASKGLGTAVYPRHVVQRAFESTGARTRYEVAMAVAKHLGSIAHRIPRKRKLWESEDPRQSLFDAAALALTHYAVILDR